MKPSVRDENKNLIKGLCKPVVNDVCFFFNDTATTEIYTLSLHDALPILTDALLVRPIEANTQSGFIYTQSEFYEEEAQPQTNDKQARSNKTGRVVRGYYFLDEIFRSDDRSEERRVGKECRSRWSPYH